ncbi:hypothetical protein GPJ56_006685 [Histomonas meleagridis]|uniref:uncharacterized protein n=1 Tax=Histomonas meleagridis TaxID=135588 RepID=UPI00355993E9|nr:hypothetical protein GPJ56_006685 [Histomonas meleagridis]KAH0805972.1 hypothetical protein GO595_001220 [Histomonas meleagridis]
MLKHSSEFVQTLKESINYIDQLNWCLKNLSERQKVLFDNPSQSVIDEISRVDTSISKQYQDSIAQVTNLISTIDEMMTTEFTEKEQTPDQITSQDRNITKILDEFFNTEIKKAEAPLPGNAGCHSNKIKMQKLRQGKIICGKRGDEYHLMVVNSFENKLVMAEDSVEPESEIVQLSPEEWTPLPTVIPKNFIPRWEFPVGAKVLALKLDGDGWGRLFYHATVKNRPCDLKNEEDRGYLLTFENGSEAIVPEKYVVSDPEKW